MREEIMVPDYPMPRPPMHIDLSFLLEGEEVINVQTYRVEGLKPPKWQFWRSEKIKFNLAVLTNKSRFFILDPANLMIEEKDNNY